MLNCQQDFLKNIYHFHKSRYLEIKDISFQFMIFKNYQKLYKIIF